MLGIIKKNSFIAPVQDASKKYEDKRLSAKTAFLQIDITAIVKAYFRPLQISYIVERQKNLPEMLLGFSG